MRTSLLIGSILFFAATVSASPTYVYKQPNGSIRFSSKPPPTGTKATVFSGKNSKFSIYRGGAYRPRGRAKLFLREYDSIINSVANSFAVEPGLIKAVIHVESAFNPNAVSPKGALGLMQLMPHTARTVGVSDPFSPMQNIRGGTRHLSRLIRRYSGNIRLALAAYNAGEGAVQKYNGVPPYRETVNYVKRVLELRSKYNSKA